MTHSYRVAISYRESLRVSSVRKETNCVLENHIINTQQLLVGAPEVYHKRVLVTFVGMFESEADSWS